MCLCVQTLYLASMLIKALWNNALAAKAQLSKQSSFASLLNTNLPMGNKKGLFPLLPPLCSSLARGLLVFDNGVHIQPFWLVLSE